MKTSELIGPALDWAVAKCEGVNEEAFMLFYEPTEPDDYDAHLYPKFHYSSVWAQGGPIIERECITVEYMDRNYWRARLWNKEIRNYSLYQYSSTPLIAAMRCFVASKLGDEVDVPEDLV